MMDQINPNPSALPEKSLVDDNKRKPKNQKYYECVICAMKFYNLELLSNHINVVHDDTLKKGKLSSLGVEDFIASSIDSENPESEYQTPENEDQTPGSEDHTPESEDQTPENEDHTPESDDQTPDRDDQTPEIGVQTPDSNDQTPAKDYPYKCNQCTKRFQNTAEGMDHYFTVHKTPETQNEVKEENNLDTENDNLENLIVIEEKLSEDENIEINIDLKDQENLETSNEIPEESIIEIENEPPKKTPKIQVLYQKRR